MNTASRTMELVKVIPAPPDRVWKAWSDPASLPQWWGPDGFSCRTERIDLREGGEWLFDMIAPDGTVFPNRHRIRVYRPMERIEYSLDNPKADRAHAEVTILFEPADTGTRLTLRMIFSDQAEFDMAMAHGAEPLGYQTLAKLAAFVAARNPGA